MPLLKTQRPQHTRVENRGKRVSTAFFSVTTFSVGGKEGGRGGLACTSCASGAFNAGRKKKEKGVLIPGKHKFVLKGKILSLFFH